ncbi:hypothetical protein O181_074807 [Austropuccinia psidii MF-1]|uniref:Uncharacterized protein n=1 Tax=Austropuccinia psidii MF-1 TaxID=1389203 RepID=A0A9Q3ICA8_9BASI|nr:hypothetical protein [Austropuccinia psidii MF-1]
MLEMLRRNCLPVMDGADFPHPLGQWVLSQFANPIRSISFDRNKGRASVLPPNNAIIFRHNNAIKYGLVKAIYNFHGPTQKSSLEFMFFSTILAISQVTKVHIWLFWGWSLVKSRQTTPS